MSDEPQDTPRRRLTGRFVPAKSSAAEDALPERARGLLRQLADGDAHFDWSRVGGHDVWRGRQHGTGETVVVKTVLSVATARAVAGRGVAPRVLAADDASGICVMEDLGPTTLLDMLSGGDADAASQGLLELAHSLGRLHGWSSAPEPSTLRLRPVPRLPLAAFTDICMTLGVDAARARDEFIEAERCVRNENPQVVVHGDPCPDNFVWMPRTGQGWRRHGRSRRTPGHFSGSWRPLACIGWSRASRANGSSKPTTTASLAPDSRPFESGGSYGSTTRQPRLTGPGTSKAPARLPAHSHDDYGRVGDRWTTLRCIPRSGPKYLDTLRRQHCRRHREPLGRRALSEVSRGKKGRPDGRTMDGQTSLGLPDEPSQAGRQGALSGRRTVSSR